MKSISVIALERAIEELKQQKTIAVRKAAKPFDDKIHLLLADITKLEGREEISDLEPQISDELAIPIKRGRKPRLNTTSFVYPINGTVLSKVLYLIKEAGRFITIREIANMAVVYEPKLSADEIKLQFGKHMGKYRVQKHIVSYQVKSKLNTFYGLPAWLKVGKAIEGREHDENVLIGVSSEDKNVNTVPKGDLFKDMDLNYNLIFNQIKQKVSESVK